MMFNPTKDARYIHGLTCVIDGKIYWSIGFASESDAAALADAQNAAKVLHDVFAGGAASRSSKSAQKKMLRELKKADSACRLAETNYTLIRSQDDLTPSP